ncbi:MAG: hypothetical protein CM1200mP10_13490 [Candidatus Neomarinimicrobiota bacterium]|nr:MAG: hypothetical protein CM1200mP10_13490 [Candidatus Neomarinimicrobiota bacterium]
MARLKKIFSQIKSLKTGLIELEKMNVSFAIKEGKTRKSPTKIIREAELDETRLAQEVALLAERADVTEETVRLKSHYDQG